MLKLSCVSTLAVEYSAQLGRVKCRGMYVIKSACGTDHVF